MGANATTIPWRLGVERIGLKESQAQGTKIEHSKYKEQRQT
jgi:hypothetical protein